MKYALLVTGIGLSISALLGMLAYQPLARAYIVAQTVTDYAQIALGEGVLLFLAWALTQYILALLSAWALLYGKRDLYLTLTPQKGKDEDR